MLEYAWQSSNVLTRANIQEKMAIQHCNMGEGVIVQYDWLNCAFWQSSCHKGHIVKVSA